MRLEQSVCVVREGSRNTGARPGEAYNTAAPRTAAISSCSAPEGTATLVL
jgi:hypothetical protein